MDAQVVNKPSRTAVSQWERKIGDSTGELNRRPPIGPDSLDEMLV